MTDIKPFFLLTGPENGQKALFIDSIKQKLSKTGGGKPEEYRFYAFESDMQEVLSIIRNSSLFAASKLVFIASAEKIKKAEDIKLLSAYFKQPAKDAVLILQSDEINIDKRLEKAAGKDSKKIFWELFENQKHDWIRTYFKKKNMEIDGDAVDLLLETVENDTQDLEKECSRLSLYFSAKGKIDSSDIETYIFHSKDENVFTLFETVARQDFKAGLDILQNILLSGSSDSVQLLAGLLWQFRRLMVLKSLLNDNFGFEEACSRLKIRSKKNKRMYSEGSRNFSLQNLEQIIVCAAEFDRMLRSLRPAVHETLLKLFLYRCIIKKGAR
jgi:DNA polymerase-3 subunit delta